MKTQYLLISLCLISVNAASVDDDVYSTFGVHNSEHKDKCQYKSCTYLRKTGEPDNPIYPEYWVSDWDMYVVSKQYEKYPPPYDTKPPVQLEEGVDYEKSYGTSYYDSTWTDPVSGKQEGAMMEHYVKRCLPIFPIDNNYTCSFISLGDTAFFIAGEGRPHWMPDVCLFSKFNHPPRRDFIKHLPYSASDSQRIGPGGQGYSFWLDASSGKPFQTGVSPVPPADPPAIMFGYGFQKKGDKVMPQSFYFSGYPVAPANAPIVSQNYTNFREEKPAPADTWALVSNIDPSTLQECQLFNPPTQSNSKLTGNLTQSSQKFPTWADIGRPKRPSQKNN